MVEALAAKNKDPAHVFCGKAATCIVANLGKSRGQRGVTSSEA